MPEKQTIERARADKREGKSPSTQAGEFVREEIHHIREGKHGARSTKQAIAIGQALPRHSSRSGARRNVGGIACIALETGARGGPPTDSRRTLGSRRTGGANERSGEASCRGAKSSANQRALGPVASCSKSGADPGGERLRRTNMHTLTLDDKEKKLLLEFLEPHLKELAHEIHKTDSRDYREGLEARTTMLKQLLTRLRET